MGKDIAHKDFTAWHQEAKSQFSIEYITPSGRMTSDSQTAYTLGIIFDLFEKPSQKARAGARLAEIVRRNRFRIGTGFACAPHILHALVLTGYPQVAYGMMVGEECPSWLYPITMVATTLWERWDSMRPNGKVNPGDKRATILRCWTGRFDYAFVRDPKGLSTSVYK